MIQTKPKERDNNPVVVISIIVMGLAAMLILAFNFFIHPDRATELNPVGKEGTRIAAPQNAPAGSMKNNIPMAPH